MDASRDIPRSAAPEYEAGTRVGGYLIERLIGVGGMADVYLARHGKLDKQVAIKVLRAQSRERSDLRARFLREGQAASRIRDPHVVEIYDVGTDGDVPYLVMQYLPGPTLEEFVAERGALDIAEAVHIFLPICAAVAAGHEQGVIHRDLKPDNVILATEGHRTRPTVLDFGVSRLVTSDPRLTLDSSVVGTPHYMSPEQARGEAIDSKTDQYALGVMLYQAVTGRLPRDRASVLELLNEVGHKGFEPPSEHRPGMSREFEAVILKAMAPARRDRFLTLHDFAGALLPFASESARAFWSEELGIQPMRVDSAQIPAPLITTPDAPTLAGPVTPRTQVEPPATMSEAPPPRSRTGLWVGLVVLLLLLAGAVAYPLLAPSPSYVVQLSTEPSTARIEIDGEVIGTGAASIRFDADGTSHRLRVFDDGYEEHASTFRDVAPPDHVTLRPQAAEAPAEEAPNQPAPAPEPVAETAPSDEAPDTPPEAASEDPTRSATRPRQARRPTDSRAATEASAPAAPADPPPEAAPPSEPAATEEGWRPRNSLTDNVDPWN